MGRPKSKEALYKEAEGFHTSLDRRLRMLLRKSFLSEDEELEMKMLKKEKLYYKDIMEGLKEESRGPKDEEERRTDIC
jgi:hypothetical protein